MSPVKTGTSHEPPAGRRGFRRRAAAKVGAGCCAEDGMDNQRLIASHLQRAAEVVIVENGHGVLERLTAPDDNGPRCSTCRRSTSS